jgi:hypothetical protein
METSWSMFSHLHLHVFVSLRLSPRALLVFTVVDYRYLMKSDHSPNSTDFPYSLKFPQVMHCACS